ncbi:response regulator transcription factor [Flavitalea antarctica]
MKINIGVVDDHQLFLKSLSSLLKDFPGFYVLLEATNGESLLQKLQQASVLPDILLLDVNMPIMDGPATAQAVSTKYPTIKLVALSMKEDDTSVISMIKSGCCSYLLKDIHPDQLEKALLEINEKGYYNADVMNINYRRLLLKTEDKIIFSERERTFLKLACSDLTYKQIANEMHLSERTIDGYRETLFEKLNVQSRVGMVLEALRRNLVTL